MSDVSSQERAADWPVCPNCGSRRSTACPFCHTSGADFKPARTDFGQLFDLPADGGCSGGCCGADGCGSGHEHGEIKANPAAEESPEEPPAMVLCPTCDEPFEPVYLARCEWCGHDFPDGIAPPPGPEDAAHREPPNMRVVVVMAGIVGLAIALAIYFGRLF